MAEKNETPVLVLALLITIGMIGGGLWWFTHNSGINLGQLGNSTSASSNSRQQSRSNSEQSSTSSADLISTRGVDYTALSHDLQVKL